MTPLFKLEDLITRRNSLTSNKDSEIIRTPPVATEEIMEEDKTPLSERNNQRMVPSFEHMNDINRVQKQLNFENYAVSNNSDRQGLPNLKNQEIEM